MGRQQHLKRMIHHPFAGKLLMDIQRLMMCHVICVFSYQYVNDYIVVTDMKCDIKLLTF